jgi:hypothetical protein
MYVVPVVDAIKVYGPPETGAQYTLLLTTPEEALAVQRRDTEWLATAGMRAAAWLEWELSAPVLSTAVTT